MLRILPSVLVASCVLGAVASAGPTQEPIVYRPGSGVSAPRLIHDVKPQYTPDAMRAKVQGNVELEFVVLPDGTVGDAKVVRSLDAGLDQEAVKAVKQWRFKPGTKDGEPVAVRVSAELTFTLRDKKTQTSLLPQPVSSPGPAKSGAVRAGVFKPGLDVTPPKVIHEVKPAYTAGAKDAKIQGVVILDVVVGADGTVSDVRVTQPLDPALDEEAIKAVRQWTFKPGMKNGKPVPVEVTIELTFTLK